MTSVASHPRPDRGSKNDTDNIDSRFRGNDIRGFTLIELLLVVAVLLTLTGMTPTFYNRFLLQNAVSNTTDQLAGSIRKAQIYSMVGKQNSNWSVNYSSNRITVYKGTNFAGRDQALDEKFSVNPAVSITWASDIQFIKLTGAQSTAVTSVTISGGNNSDVLSLNAQGVVSR
jgi:prepilin-type N-terminal cleavage/methylation domain-containing protein